MTSKNTTENLGKLKVGEIMENAAGLSAILKTTSDIVKKAGAIRGTKLLLALNQKGGIDCNSCAWADPDGERTHAEFCESGAKAIADEVIFLHQGKVEEQGSVDEVFGATKSARLKQFLSAASHA